MSAWARISVDQFGAAKQVFAEADEALGFSLSELCFAGPEADLKLTENTQPAILTVSIAALRVLEAETDTARRLMSPAIVSVNTARWSPSARLAFRDAVKIVRAARPVDATGGARRSRAPWR